MVHHVEIPCAESFAQCLDFEQVFVSELEVFVADQVFYIFAPAEHEVVDNYDLIAAFLRSGFSAL